MRNIIDGLCLAFSFLTRFNLRNGKIAEMPPRAASWSFFFYPLTGAVMGLIAGIPTVAFCLIYPHEQTVVLFSSVIYLALLEWQARYLHFDGFCDACDAFAAVGATPERRLEIMKDPHMGSAGLGCGVFLIVAKVLGLYLIFTRSALFTQDLTMLLFVLAMIPSFGRMAIITLAAAGDYPREKGTGSFIVGKVSPGILFILFIIMLLFSSLYLGLHFRFGALFSLHSLEVTSQLIRNINTVLSGYNWLQILVLFGRGFNAALLLFIIAILMPTFYWYRQSKKLIGGVTGDILGALCELSELAAIFAFLFIAEGF